MKKTKLYKRIEILELQDEIIELRNELEIIQEAVDWRPDS